MTSGLKKTHEEYDFNLPNWQKVRDLNKGERALKERDLSTIQNYRYGNNGDNNSNLNNVLRVQPVYLPMPNVQDCSQENLLRYQQYIQRAALFNATGRTEQGMSGMVFGGNNDIELAAPIEYLITDADGSEVGIEQQSKEVLSDVLQTGREGLLVDYPQTESPTTVQEAESLGVRAGIIIYKAESILDWRTKKVGASMVLSYVKLMEVTTQPKEDNIFETEEVTKYRVLMLNDEGQYEVRIYTKEGDSESSVPRDANGATFSYIPFFFIGAVNNRPNVDPAPLLEIAEVNIHHYRNSADFEESAFIVGQPTPVMNGLNQAWVDKNFKNGIGFGSRSGISLPVGADAKLLQAQPNNLPKEGMMMKEEQMIQLGARLITPGGQSETAEAARIKHAADASVLSVVVQNIVQAYQDAIAAVIQFTVRGSAPDFTFELNDDFFASKLTPEERNVLIAEWQAGLISKPVAQQKLKNGGVIDEDIDLEVMNDQIDQDPAQGNLGFGTSTADIN